MRKDGLIIVNLKSIDKQSVISPDITQHIA